LAGLLALPSAFSSVIVGLPPDPKQGNGLPFSDPQAFNVSHYQQVYAAQDFPGALAITALTFFHTQFPDRSALSKATYTLSLSTVSANVLTFNSLINVGADNAQLFNGPLPASAPVGSSFTLGGGSFSFDPSKGNLLLDIVISAGEDGDVPLDSRSAAFGIFSRATNGSNTGTMGYGLVTRFEVVPEPSGTALLIAGSSVLGFPWLRRRRSQAWLGFG
jgi:hypothetical protein